MKYRVKKVVPGQGDRIKKGEVRELNKDSSGMYSAMETSTSKIGLWNIDKKWIDEYFEPVSEKPMSWEELEVVKGRSVDENSSVLIIDGDYPEPNTRPTEEMAEAQLALSQLMQLRDAWRDGWKIDTSFYNCVYFKEEYSDEVLVDSLSFEDDETRDLFQKTFSKLIEKIKPLYFS